MHAFFLFVEEVAKDLMAREMHSAGLEERRKHASVEAKRLKVFVNVSLSFSHVLVY
jgi:hypothetical protein